MTSTTCPRLIALAVVVATGAACNERVSSRLERIKERGELVCGIKAGIAGFAKADAQGRYQGMDVDMCRAVAAAILSDGERVRFEPAASLSEMDGPPEIDIASRRLTWSLRREGMGVLFGPVMFYDGQGFMVMAAAPTTDASQLAGQSLCVYPGSEHDVTLTSYFTLHDYAFQRVAVADGAAAVQMLRSGQCAAFSTDLSELASVRSELPAPDDVRILPGLISREPLAQLVRASDVDLFNILRWTLFAMISAEELGVTSTNVEAMKASADPDIRRLLGVTPGNGASLGLDEAWAARVIGAVGNYGELFARHVGPDTPIGLQRGANDLWTRGGLMFAPPLR